MEKGFGCYSDGTPFDGETPSLPMKGWMHRWKGFGCYSDGETPTAHHSTARRRRLIIRRRDAVVTLNKDHARQSAHGR
ncbi:MAG: hypothetical protein IKZ46_15040 [Victivallales bacterium]|nr:hypothetical protein [Victivallales bacterium]